MNLIDKSAALLSCEMSEFPMDQATGPARDKGHRLASDLG